MHDAHEFLRSLTIVLSVAALTTVVFRRLGQPVVLGYIVAGLIVGPHVPLPLIADPAIVRALSELGVILLMFYLGLEFRLGKLAALGPTAGITALIQAGLLSWLGFMVGRNFGWTSLESVFLGAAIAISSTTIIAKVFDEQQVGGRHREVVVGILLMEDLIAIVFMAALTAIATGAGLSAAALAATVAKLAAFLVALLAVGMLAVPRFMRVVLELERDETTLVASIGVCFLVAYVAQAFGYSVALGAFLAGSLVAESGHAAETVAPLVRPVRDVFAAVFFVSVGLLIDPHLMVEHWPAIVAVTLVVLCGNFVGVTIGAFLTGSSVRTAIQASMSLAQIGEFSFIIAGLGTALGAIGPFVYPVVVAVSAITTLTTPWLVRAAEPVAELIDRKLPHPLQTFTTFYGAWLERLREGAVTRQSREVPRILRLVAIDVALLSVIIVAAALSLDAGAARLDEALGLGAIPSALVVVAAALAATLPFLVGIGRLSRRLGRALAEAAMPRPTGTLDLDAAPRRALIIMLQLGVALASGLVVVAVTQPFLPSYPGPVVLGVLLVVFAIALWQSATDLEGHVRAGSQAIVEALGAYARGNDGGAVPPRLTEIHRVLRGLGEPVAIRLDPESPGVGKTLADLNLRGRTGASVIAIIRNGVPVVPAATEPLAAGDVLAIAGTREAIEAATAMLRGPSAPPSRRTHRGDLAF